MVCFLEVVQGCVSEYPIFETSSKPIAHQPIYPLFYNRFRRALASLIVNVFNPSVHFSLFWTCGRIA